MSDIREDDIQAAGDDLRDLQDTDWRPNDEELC